MAPRATRPRAHRLEVYRNTAGSEREVDVHCDARGYVAGRMKASGGGGWPPDGHISRWRRAGLGL